MSGCGWIPGLQKKNRFLPDADPAADSANLPGFIEQSYLDLRNEGESECHLKLQLVDEHIRGRWRMIRFVFGFSFLIFILLSTSAGFSGMLQSALGIPSKDFLLCLLVLLFIIGIGAWIYWKREKLAINFSFIDSVQSRFGCLIRHSDWLAENRVCQINNLSRPSRNQTGS